MILLFDSTTKKMIVDRGNKTLTEFLNEIIGMLNEIKKGEYSLSINYMDSDVFEHENSSNTLNISDTNFKIG